VSTKTYLVTGAAKGIGAAVAARLAQDSAQLMCMDIDAEGLKALQGSLADSPGKIAIIAGSVASTEDCAAAVKACVDTYGGIDGLSHNAGIQRYGNALSTSDSVWHVDTPMLQAAVAGAENPKAVWNAIHAMHPLGRPAAPAEIANIAAFLLSNEASFITGETIRADGGLLSLIGGSPATEQT